MRNIIVPQEEVLEDIQALSEIPGHSVTVYVGIWDNNKGDWVIPQIFKTYIIEKGMYEELVSANPEWAPSKPAGTYRNEDLWRFIDIIREEKQTSA